MVKKGKRGKRTPTSRNIRRVETIKEFHKLYFDKRQKERALQKLEMITPKYLYRYRPAHRIESESLTFDEISSLIDGREMVSSQELCELIKMKKDGRKGGFDELIQMILNHDFSIWFTHPHNFNDPYDSFVSQNIDGLFSDFQGLVDDSPRMVENYYHNINNSPIPESQDDKNRVLFTAVKNAIFSPVDDLPNHLSDEQAALVRTSSDYHLRNILTNSNYSFSESLSKNIGVACFSEEKNSLLMWSHYAENHTGYCLEYKTEDIKAKSVEMICGLFPVKYTVKFNNIDNYMPIFLSEVLDSEGFWILLKSIMDKIDTLNEDNLIEGVLGLLFTSNHVKTMEGIISTVSKKLFEDEDFTLHYLKRCSQKATDWKYEKEWRIIRKIANDADLNEKRISLTPTCIYLGAKTSDEDVKRVVKAVGDSGLQIPIKRMYMNLDYMQLFEEDVFYVTKEEG